MTERERLIELLCKIECEGEDRRDNGCTFRQDSRCNIIQKLDMCMIKTIADHLLANGVIVPPVKIGQTVYSIEPCISQVFVGEVYEIFQRRYGMVCRSSRKGYYSLAFPADSVGKTVFLTREEAEKALEKRSKI